MTWLRRNRWWLLVLPLAVLLLVVGSAHRLQWWWWRADYHERIDRAALGEWAHWEDTEEFFNDGGERSFDVRLVSVEDVEEVPAEYGEPTPLPAGSEGVLVKLEFRNPVGDNTGCRAILVAEDGTRYGDGFDQPFDQQTCGPANYGDDPDATWTATSVFAVDPGAAISRVWIVYDGGWRYVQLDLPEG